VAPWTILNGERRGPRQPDEDAMHERISIDPDVGHGQACIRGTRIPVHQVVGMLANGDSVDDLLGEYPSLRREDVFACLAYRTTES
jgi:uncharacterized protein (DUF433 family)